MGSFSNDSNDGVARDERDALQLPLHTKLSLHSESPAVVTEGGRGQRGFRDGSDGSRAVAAVGPRVKPLADRGERDVVAEEELRRAGRPAEGTQGN